MNRGQKEQSFLIQEQVLRREEEKKEAKRDALRFEAVVKSSRVRLGIEEKPVNGLFPAILMLVVVPFLVILLVGGF